MPAQATVALEKAKRLEPEKASIREALGIAYFRIKRWAEAEAEFRKVLELSPADDYAHYALGGRSGTRAAHDEAATHLKLARSLRPAPRPTSSVWETRTHQPDSRRRSQLRRASCFVGDLRLQVRTSDA